MLWTHLSVTESNNETTKGGQHATDLPLRRPEELHLSTARSGLVSSKVTATQTRPLRVHEVPTSETAACPALSFVDMRPVATSPAL